MPMKRLLAFLPVAAAALSLGGCISQQQQKNNKAAYNALPAEFRAQVKECEKEYRLNSVPGTPEREAECVHKAQSKVAVLEAALRKSTHEAIVEENAYKHHLTPAREEGKEAGEAGAKAGQEAAATEPKASSAEVARENEATKKVAEEQCGRQLADGEVEQVANGGGCPKESIKQWNAKHPISAAELAKKNAGCGPAGFDRENDECR
jgi:hypothetical protein